MIIYKDLFSDDELCSDTYACELLDGVVFCIKGKYTTEKTELDGSKFGANASEENPDEGGGEDPSAVSGIDVVLANRLIETGFKKKDYLVHIKGYVARVLKKLEENGKPEEEIAQIKKGLAIQVKLIIADFKDYQFFMGESANEDGMMIPVKYDEDGTTPRIYLFKHGLIEEKV